MFDKIHACLSQEALKKDHKTIQRKVLPWATTFVELTMDHQAMS